MKGVRGQGWLLSVAPFPGPRGPALVTGPAASLPGCPISKATEGKVWVLESPESPKAVSLWAWQLGRPEWLFLLSRPMSPAGQQGDPNTVSGFENRIRLETHFLSDPQVHGTEGELRSMAG